MGNIEDVHIEPQWRLGLRAFVGYAGWSQGQLEGEIGQKAWLVLPPARELVEMKEPENAWRQIMRNSGPLMKLLAEAPDDPEMN
jgi:putative transcriptional regulator